MRISQTEASTQPAPSAGPLTAAMTGIAQWRTALKRAAHDLGAFRILLGRCRQEFLEIEAGAERPRAGAGENRAMDVGARADRLERVGDLAIHRQRQRIDRRPVDRDGDDLARGFDDEFGHIGYLILESGSGSGGSMPSGSGISCAFRVIATMV